MSRNTFEMVRDLVTQLDAITERNYPTYDKYAARAGALQAVLTTTLAHLTENQREVWVESQDKVYLIQMESEVRV